MSEWDVKICCMGAGYVGGPTMAVIAKQCPKVRNYVRVCELCVESVVAAEAVIHEVTRVSIGKKRRISLHLEGRNAPDVAELSYGAVL